jgi:hypothetical protein
LLRRTLAGLEVVSGVMMNPSDEGIDPRQVSAGRTRLQRGRRAGGWCGFEATPRRETLRSRPCQPNQ